MRIDNALIKAPVKWRLWWADKVNATFDRVNRTELQLVIPKMK